MLGDYSYLLSYLVFLFLWMVAPGPCFALVARNSVKFGTKSGIFTALGMVVCDTLFIFLAVIGIAEFLKLFPKVLSAGKMIGSAYILYIGIDIFLSTFKKNADGDIKVQDHHNKPSKLFLMGFLTDAANPLLIIGMLAIVLSFIDLNGSLAHITFYSMLIPITTTYVTFGIAFCFGNKIIRKIILPYIKWFERLAGLIICLLAVLTFIN
jgi:threonine/homoserine/homoserine lactone efflux protein